MAGGLGLAFVGSRPQKRGHDHIGPFGQSHLDGHVGHQAAVHIGLAFHLNGRKHGGGRHAGTNRQMQGTTIKHLHLAVAVARGHSPKWDFQIIKVDFGRQVLGQGLQQGQETLPIAHAPGKTHPAVFDAELQIHRVFFLVGACA